MGEDATRASQGRAWAAFCDRLEKVGEQILAAAPEDPFDQAEGLRYLGRLTRSFLRTGLEHGQPNPVSLIGETPKIGLDNPDYVYGQARLDPLAEYRLRGRIGDAELIGFGSYSGGLGTAQGLVRDGYLESGQLERDEEGRFEIAVHRRPRPGNWLPMGEGTNALQVRVTLLERAHQQVPPLELLRLGEVPAPSPLDPARFARALDRTGSMIEGVVGQFLGWTASFEAHKHEIRPIDPSLLAVAQGDPNTSYHYGYWELGPDEAFVIELDPPDCEYWNLQIGNHWLESLDFMHHQTHVNHRTAVRNEDGSVTIVVAPRDPGRPNWLDTVGHARGALALRWVGASEIPVPRTRVALISALSP